MINRQLPATSGSECTVPGIVAWQTAATKGRTKISGTSRSSSLPHLFGLLMRARDIDDAPLCRSMQAQSWCNCTCIST